jgi:hypothetical protein
MLAALDALIQNGSSGRKALVLRQLCSLFMTLGADDDGDRAALFDEVMANVASDLDDESVLVLMPEVQKMPGVLPAFVETISSRFHEISQRQVGFHAAPSEPLADWASQEDESPSTLNDAEALTVDAALAPVAEGPAPATATTSPPETISAEKSAAETVLCEIPAEPSPEATPFAAAQAPRPDRRAVPRVPVADAENPITIARRASLSELAAIAGTPNLPESITNVLVARGYRAVLETALRNRTASFARSSLTTLAELAPSDRMIKEALISRRDLPEPIAERLMPFLTLHAKAQLLMNGSPFGEAEAQAALDQAAADLITAYRQGQTLMGVDTALAKVEEGTATVSDATIQLARDIRIAELAAFMAKRLAIRHLTAFNVLSGRFDHATAVLLRALDISLEAFDAVMTMRRRCGCREARETRSVHAIAQRYTPAEALVLVRQMDEVEQGGNAEIRPVEQQSAAESLAA